MLIWEQVEYRTIVKYGIYKFEESVRRSFGVKVLAHVERSPENRFDNFKRQKSKSHFGYMQAMFFDTVVHEVELAFDRQEIFYWNGLHNNQIVHELCLFSQLQQFLYDGGAVNLGTAPQPPQPLDVMAMPIDRLVFKLYSNTTLNIYVMCMPFFANCELKDPIWNDPVADGNPLADIPVPPNPNDENGRYDFPMPPYDGINDDGETYVPEDVEPPLDPSTAYLVTINYTNTGTGGNIGSFTFQEVIVGGVTTPTSQTETGAGGNTTVQLRFTERNSGAVRSLNPVNGTSQTPATSTVTGFTQVPI